MRINHPLVLLCTAGSVFVAFAPLSLSRSWITLALPQAEAKSMAEGAATAQGGGLSVEERKRELSTRSSGLVSEAIEKRLSRAQELANSKKYKEAVELLQAYLVKGSVRPSEKALLEQNVGFILAQKGDYKKAIEAMQRALNTKALPMNPTLTTMYAMGQMQVAVEDYAKAIATLEDWRLFVPDMKPEAMVTLATAYSQNGQKAKGLEWVEKAIESSPKPAENWLLFALGLNYEQEKWARCIEYLNLLTAQFPKKSQYWKQLSGVYLNLSQNSKALAILELAHKQGYLEKEGEIINLVALYLDQGIPLKAAKLLQSAIESKMVEANRKTWELLGDSYFQARETKLALQAFERAAKLASDGKVFVKQGQIFLDMENWQEAEKALSQALTKGEVAHPEQILLGLGIAKFYQKDLAGAGRDFKKATTLKADFRAAQQWLDQVEMAAVSEKP